MKRSISFPATDCQKLIEVEDECKLCTFYEKHLAIEVAADTLGEEWKGHMVQISQVVLTHGHVHLLPSKGHSYYTPRRTGEEMFSTWLLQKKGKKDIPGITNTTVPCCLGPKRASTIHKLFSFSKEYDVPQHVVRKPLNKEGKKPRTKAPKTQCLVIPGVLQHKRWCVALKKQCTNKNKVEDAEYAKPLAKRMKEAKENHQEQTAERQRLSSLRAATLNLSPVKNEIF
ncbi:unnamed protein product [Nyctereutes procyonoides]|uniref:40S ribosomal protein S6 n=1 Tax=Nyctereutes procyonoides TaxID=34880 RepID=A0A811YUT8_NYCPR|nr:unnamed protein product [Nyctereutes procyonoides]